MLGASTQKLLIRPIQLIGLPGSGKTTALKTLADTLAFTYLDIRDYQTDKTYDRLLADVANASSQVILESACGIRKVHPSIVIYLAVPFAIACKRCENRDGHVDHDYMSLLKTQLMSWDYVTTNADLGYLLQTLLRGSNESH